MQAPDSSTRSHPVIAWIIYCRTYFSFQQPQPIGAIHRHDRRQLAKLVSLSATSKDRGGSDSTPSSSDSPINSEAHHGTYYNQLYESHPQLQPYDQTSMTPMYLVELQLSIVMPGMASRCIPEMLRVPEGPADKPGGGKNDWPPDSEPRGREPARWMVRWRSIEAF